MTLDYDLFVYGGGQIERGTPIKFNQDMVVWADKTLGYIPRAFVCNSRVHIWFKNAEDKLLYQVFTGNRPVIEISLN